MLNSARILIVEDEGLVALDLQSRLQRLGYTVVGIADTRERAMSIALVQLPELVLMDIHLAGGSDGVTAAEEIHETLGLPIVFLTAYADTETLDRAAKVAPFGYIVKPFEERSLAATIQMALARRDAEVKVQQMERWLATTLRSIGDAVISVGADGRINYFNHRAELLTGWMRGEALGMDYREVLIFIHEEAGMPSPPHPVAEAMESGLVFHLAPQTELVMKTGGKVPVDDSAAATRDEKGRVNGVILVLRDRSQQRRDEQERRKIEEKMQEAQRLESLGVLAGGIAHDFNNLLGAMLVNAELAGSSLPPGQPAHENLSEIVLAGKRAAELCQQMLAYAGKGKYQETRFDLNHLIKDTVTLLRAVIQKKADLRLCLDGALPPTLGDSSQIRQVIMNLVINASDALGENPGSITVETRGETVDRATLNSAVVGSELPEGNYLLLEVRDTGCGMTEETRSHIFDPFFTTKFTGRGLGLAAVLGIVRSHRGALLLDSTPEMGTTFRVLLPIAAGSVEEPAPLDEVSEQWKGHGSILVVDDEAPIRTAAARVLEHFGFTTHLARDGQEALEILERSHAEIRLVMTDLTMPRLSGFEMASQAARLYPNLPFLVMSGYSADAATERFAQLPIKGFLQKPFSVQMIEKVVRGILECPSAAAVAESHASHPRVEQPQPV